MTLPDNMLTSELAAKRERLLVILRDMNRVAVAFSGGVDSAVVAKAARLALADRAIAITADSPSVARQELADARRVAAAIGIRHLVLGTAEFADADYVRNDGARCYFCKSELYTQIEAMLPELGDPIVCSGANQDDMGDYRPGLTAAAEHQVRHPLQEAGFTKPDVRAMAKAWGLDIWDKPAAPCLSSRLAPGVAVTVERTGRVEEAERLLHELGFRECRVRLHEGELARIEVPVGELARLTADGVHESLAARLRELGFRYITLDLEGFRPGNLNQLVKLETIRRFSEPCMQVSGIWRRPMTLKPLPASASAWTPTFWKLEASCSIWPRCSTASIAAAALMTRGWIEFGKHLAC